MFNPARGWHEGKGGNSHTCTHLIPTVLMMVGGTDLGKGWKSGALIPHSFIPT